jgi:hypothetical protein
MLRGDQLPPLKLIIGGKEYITGDKTNLRLDSLKASPGATAILVVLEVTKDPDFFQKVVNAAEQKNIRVQINGKEFTAEMAMKMSYPGPPFSGKITIRQCTPLRSIITR